MTSYQSLEWTPRAAWHWMAFHFSLLDQVHPTLTRWETGLLMCWPRHAITLSSAPFLLQIAHAHRWQFLGTLSCWQMNLQPSSLNPDGMACFWRMITFHRWRTSIASRRLLKFHMLCLFIQLGTEVVCLLYFSCLIYNFNLNCNWI